MKKEDVIGKVAYLSFPENWCLAVTAHNKDMLAKWRNGGSLYKYEGYVMYEGYVTGVKGYYEPTKPKGYPEITTEQFREHVLKKTSEVVVEPTEQELLNHLMQ
jgi:hypothetical protein